MKRRIEEVLIDEEQHGVSYIRPFCRCQSYLEVSDYTSNIRRYWRQERAPTCGSVVSNSLRDWVSQDGSRIHSLDITLHRPQRAKKLAERGFRTLEDIMKDKETFGKLPHSIQTSMKYSSITVKQVQRTQIDHLASLISKALSEFEIYITGS